MLVHPQFDPIIFQLGPLAVRWYGLMYLCGFAAFWYLGTKRARRAGSFIHPDQVSDFLFYAVLGVIIGGRVGSVIFYNFDHFLANPLYIFKIWEGGMSFHGGLIGVLIATWLYQSKRQWGFFRLSDFIAPLVPLGLGFGRIGNFINGELWGRPTESAWGMIFPLVDNLERHPSQLYQAMLEGVMMFIVLWVYSAKPRATGSVSGWFLILYGAFRFIVEFARQPDGHLGFIAFNWLTMGQLLSVPMIAAGFLLLWLANKNVFENKV
jgi:phosphatidylglycerol:prolipoprotein diacylglycerol transferase|tara:strand:+ start:2748 stop:3542 length:795 start_codon:yes stop_codon:yes gene_type:complete